MPATQYAFRQYTGDGSTTTFAVPFPYLLKAHVKVYTGYDLASGTYTTLLADGTGYTWTSATQIQATTAPASGVVLTVIRQTPSSTQLVQWQDGSNLVASDIDTADKQNLYVVQEQVDKTEAIAAQSQLAKASADAALASVVNALPYLSIANVAAIPVSPDDGARVEVLDSTGIESFTPLSGIPAGFAGSASAKARLVYSSGAGSWSWVDYAVKDPLNLFLQKSGGVMTGAIQAANGSAAAPGFAFANDTGTGLYYATGPGIGLSVSGIRRALFNATSFVWGAPTGDCGIEIGNGATANRSAYLDLIGDTTYTDYGLRLIRNNAGPNASSVLTHRGTASLTLRTEEAAPITFQTTGLERVRITADGNLALGSSGAAGYSFLNTKALTGATTTYGQVNQGTVQSDCTSAVYYASSASTQAAAFTVGTLVHYQALQGTFGAGSAVTDQFGFRVNNSLIGATNNYGFYGNIPSGTGRWNFYAAGTADSYFASNNFIFANGGTERARVDSSGRLLLGTSTGNSLISGTLPYFQIHGTASSTSTIAACRWSADVNQSFVALSKSRGATVGTQAAVASGDTIGTVVFTADDGTSFIQAARISALVDGTPGTNDMPGRLIFSTTPSGSVNPVERMRIKSTGTINFSSVATYADNTAATAGGLAVGDVYRTATGQLMIRY